MSHVLLPGDFILRAAFPGFGGRYVREVGGGEAAWGMSMAHGNHGVSAWNDQMLDCDVFYSG